MNVIEINIDEFSSKLIEIGRQTENEVTQIKIDMSSWLETYPDMAFLVNVSRPTEDYSYPAVFQMEGNYILWTIFSSDTAIEGKGSVEIIGMEVDKKKLSAVARTCIIPCKQEDISEEPPDPFKPYYDDIIEAVDEVKDVKDKIPEIIEAGEKAEQSAESASESANNAEEYAQQAKDALYQIKYVKDVIPPEASITNKLTDRNYVDVQVEEAKSIAKGRATGYVFDTKQDLDNALLDEEFVSKLVLGDNLYIRAIGTPDYWWDGTQAQQLETQKVDLSEYRKSSEQDVIDSGKLDKVSTPTNENRLYGVNKDGTQEMKAIVTGDGTVEPSYSLGNIFVAGYTGGRLVTRTPENPYDSANKKYVDDKLLLITSTETQVGGMDGVYCPNLTSSDITAIYNAYRNGKQVRVMTVTDARRYYDVTMVSEISCMLIAQDGYTIEYYGFAGEVAIQVHNEILNKDLNDGSAVTGSNYYRHIGTTTTNFKHGVIYFYSNGTFKAIDGSGGGSVEQVQADWNETNVLAKSFIKNKPTIPNEVSVSATGFSTNEVNYITIGDDEYKIGGAELEYWE